MEVKTARKSVDLSPWPDLVVIYLGFRVTRLRGFLTLFGLGRGINAIARNKPDGLLAHEAVFFSLTHIGMRQYWRDLESLERFTKAEPHRTWWHNFLCDNGGSGFWHELYRLRGGMEAIYLDMPAPLGFGLFAPERRPQGPFMSARGRLTNRGSAAGSSVAVTSISGCGVDAGGPSLAASPASRSL